MKEKCVPASCMMTSWTSCVHYQYPRNWHVGAGLYLNCTRRLPTWIVTPHISAWIAEMALSRHKYALISFSRARVNMFTSTTENVWKLQLIDIPTSRVKVTQCCTVAPSLARDTMSAWNLTLRVSMEAPLGLRSSTRNDVADTGLWQSSGVYSTKNTYWISLISGTVRLYDAGLTEHQSAVY